MSKKEFGIRLKIDGDISDILNSLKNLKAAFNGVEMPDKLTKDLTKSIDSAIQKVGEFGKRSESAINSLSDSKEIANAWKSVSRELTALQVKLEGIDAQNLFPKEVITNLERAEAAAKKYNNALAGAKSSDSYKNKLEELNRVAELQKATEANSKKASQEALRAEATYNKEKAQWTEETNKKYVEQQQKITESNKALKDQSDKLKELLELQKKLQGEGYLTSNKTVSKTKKEAVKQLANAEADEKGSKKQVSTAKAQVTKYKNANTGKDLSKDEKYLALVKKQAEAEEEHEQILKRIKQLREQIGDTDKLNQAENIGEQINNARDLKTALENQAIAAQTSGKALQDQKNALDKAEKAYADASTDAETYKKNLKELEQQQQDINNELKSIQTSQAENEWKELVEVIKEFTDIDLSQSAHSLEQVNAVVEQYKEGQLKNLPETLKQIIANAAPVGPAMEKVGDSVKEAGEDSERMAQTAKEVENLKNQVLQFFSITNSIQLFKRAVTSALNTVKELDATMTEAAVVTEFDVGDMWDKLPSYSKEAQKLGVSINGMYQATTLYYQQGLKTNEAMQLGVETMKMGKIAAMDSTDATKAMTAALRGFNMELNETSAVRVNDVYSQLAAVTAADTNQIATAMEKTASIAASANMEFETTAALLAQIIETTQEAPETAGTAMKTIIARFAEVKSLREQGQSTGTDSEGEVVDVNKIQAALRTVGISMDGFFAGTEGLDSVLLKLSEKWDTLDFETQRYIATMAAGSRQQSRFIAMMSDYERTTELVNEAQNSAGASQRQFEKTQDSLATSIQRLENAWDEFLMGLANNDALKFAVDSLTAILETVNKLTSAVSGGNGLIKTIASLATALSALKIGRSIFGGTENTGIFGRISGAISGKQPGEQGALAKKSLGEKLQGTRFAVPEGVGKNASFREALGDIKYAKQKKKEEQQMAPDKTLKEKFNDKYKTTKTVEVIDKGKLADRMASHVNFGGENAEQIAELNQQLKKGKISADGAAQSFAKLGGDLDGVSVTTEKTSLNFDALSGTLGKAGAAMMGVSAGLGLLGGLFESLGLEGAAEATKTLGAVFMGLGTVLSTVATILPIVTSMTAAQAAALWSTVRPILAIVGGLVILITVIALVANAFKKMSDAYQLEQLTKQVDELGEAVDAAKDKFDDLTDSRNELKDMSDKLKNLTRGTLEWKQALLETNQKVLELIGNYPELAQYVQKGESGEMVIADEGWDKVLTEQQAVVAKGTAAKLALQGQVATKQQEMKTEDILAKAYGEITGSFRAERDSWWGRDEEKAQANAEKRLKRKFRRRDADGNVTKYKSRSGLGRQSITGDLTIEEYQKFAAEAAEKGLSMVAGSSKAEFEALYNEMDFGGNFDELWSAMSDAGAAFDEVANSAHAAALAEEARVTAIAEANAQSSEIIQNSEVFGSVASDLGGRMYAEKYQEKVDDLVEKTDYRENKTANNKHNAALISAYSEATGQTKDEIKAALKNGSLSYETMESTYAANEVNKEMTKAMEGLVIGLEKVTKGKSKKEQERIAGFLSDKGLGMSVKDMEALKQKGLSTFFTDEELATLAAESDQSTEELKKLLQENVESAQAAYNDAFFSAATKGMGIQIKALVDELNKAFPEMEMTVAEAKTLAASLAQVEIAGGEAEALTKLFDDLTEGLRGDDLAAAMSLLANANWESQTAINGTIEALRQMGVAIDQQLVEQVLDATNAINDMTWAEFQSVLNEKKALRDSVKSKVDEGSRVFTQEEMEQLREYGFKNTDFVMTDWGEYTYLGETNEILEKIRADTNAMAKKILEEAKEKVAKGEKIEAFYDKDGTSVENMEKLKTGKAMVERNQDMEQYTRDYIMNTNNKIPNTDYTWKFFWDNFLYYWDASEHGAGVGYQTLSKEDSGLSFTPKEKLPSEDEVQQNKARTLVFETAAQGLGFTYNPALTKEENQQIWRGLMYNMVLGQFRGTSISEEDYLSYTGAQIPYGDILTDTEMKQIAKDMGIDESEYADLTGQALADFLIKYEAEHFGPNGEKVEANREIARENARSTQQWQFVEVAGTSEFMQMRRESTDELAQLEEFYNKTTGETMRDRLIKISQDENYDFNGSGAAGFAARLLGRGDDIAGYKALAQYEGGAEAVIKDYYSLLGLSDQALEALIQNEDGLQLAFEQTAKALGLEGKALEENTIFLKNHMLGVRNTKKEIDKLNETLQDEAENLQSLNPELANAAAERIANQLTGLFGGYYTPEQVLAHKELFAQLTEGGEAAEEAWKALGQEASDNVLKTLGFEAEELEDTLVAMGGLDFSINGTADFTQIYESLAKVFDSTENLEKWLESQNYKLSYQVSLEDMNILGKTVPVPKVKAVLTKIGPGGTTDPFSGSGGGGGGSTYDNSHDKFYNTYEKINALLREREKIERRYDKLLKNRALSAQDLIKNSREELANLEAERKYQEEIQQGKLQQIRDLRSKNSKYNNYVTDFDEKTGVISINWDALEKLRNSERGEAVDEYLSELESLRDQWQEAQDNLDGIEDKIEEIREQGKDEYFNFEEQVKEALINSRQKEIDKLSEINDSINETNQTILDSMQKQIDEYRENRDNEKTEEEISDKQRRLAYLQQDTSGANALEILNLQKEIEESQEDYTDTLIDQKISDLQEQNDMAAEQRERQIFLLEAQLEQYQTSGAIWEDVYRLIESDLTAEGAIEQGSRLEQLLQDAAEYTGLSNLGKKEWQQELAVTIAKAFGYISLNRATKGQSIDFVTSDSRVVTGTADEHGNIITEDGFTYSKVHQNHRGYWVTEEAYQEKAAETPETPKDWNYNYPKPSENSGVLRYGSSGDRVRGLQQALLDLDFSEVGSVDGYFGPNTLRAVKRFQSEMGIDVDGQVGPQTRDKFRLKGFKTGGLADFTGPAWLDGTKSRPEYILNAEQTKGFFTLVDVLSSLQTKSAQTTQNNGDNTYDIDINVESIGNDYDVEQLAETVKRLINDDARYRNNNAINLMR